MFDLVSCGWIGCGLVGYGLVGCGLVSCGLVGCGLVSWAVASNIRDLLLRSSHQKKFTIMCLEKTKIKRKRPWKVQLFEKNSFCTDQYIKEWLFVHTFMVHISSLWLTRKKGYNIWIGWNLRLRGSWSGWSSGSYTGNEDSPVEATHYIKRTNN